MALRIIETADERLVTGEVTRALRDALGARGAAVLLVPSFAQALDAQRMLAAAGGLSLGVTVTTPAAWACERWEVWGDGRRPVDDAARSALCARLLAEAASSGEKDAPRPSAGAAALLADLARAGLPWMRCAEAPEGVTLAEARVVSLLEPYARRLGELGLAETAEIMAALPDALDAAGADVPPLVWAGFSRLGRAERELCCALARAREVTLVAPAGEGPAHAEVRALLGALVALAERVGAPAERVTADPAPSRARRAPELARVLSTLFVGGGRVEPTGAVRLLLPAGPSAAPELVARAVRGLADEGARDVVVVAPDAPRAFDELAPRLVARGLTVRGELTVPFSSLGAGRAFLGYVTAVARLAELDATWPPAVPVPDAPRAGTVRVSLGDMSWWPPRELSDFLMSDVSGLSPDAARRLDAEWRGNRLLTPAAVLEQLRSERRVSAEVAAATRELLRGRLGSAASKLLAPYARGERPGAPEGPDAVAALSAVLGVSRSLRELGLTADPDAPGRVSLAELVGVARGVLARTGVTLRPEYAVPGAPCAVRLMAPAAAARLAPASADALVLLGQTSAESDAGAPDDALTALLDLYGVEARPSPMDAARARFAALVRVPRRALVVERSLFGADGKECYPSVMLTELLACYGLGADEKPASLAEALGSGRVLSRSETDVSENASRAGAPARRDASEVPAPAGRIDASERALVSPPPEGVDDARPLLSASQIETYLDCPYKWFSLRRLRLRDADAGFTGAEEGTFAHRVLEVTRRELLARAVERAEGTRALADARAQAPDALQDPAYRDLADRLAVRAAQDPAARLPGSALDSAEALETARAVLGEEFDAHLLHQHQLVRGKPLPQALVAHSARQEGQVARLRRDLSTLLEYESEALVGFEPRLFEWRFGSGGDAVEYAGARLTGTVDRVDVDAHGQAVVIDYKHKAAARFAAEYDAFPKEGADGGDLALPRHVQSLIYAQVIRRAFPDLAVRAAVYLCTKGTHEIAGAVDEELIERVGGSHAPTSRRVPRLAVPRGATFGREGEKGMDALLDACEEAVAESVARMLDGDIEARPRDAAACDYCPVLNCERRLRK